MRSRRCLDSVAEAFVKIRFAVAIQIMQARDLIPAQHIHFSLAHFEAKRLKQARRKSFPPQLPQPVVDARHTPDIAVDAAHPARTVRCEIHARQKHQRLPRVIVRNRQRVDGQDVRFQRALPNGFEFLAPMSRARLRPSRHPPSVSVPA